MKLKVLVNGFAGLKAVFDSIEKFDEKWKNVPAYKEVKDAIEMYNDERKKIIQELSNADGEVEPKNVSKLNGKIENLQNTEIELKKKLTFDKSQVEKAKITVSQIESIMDFIK